MKRYVVGTTLCLALLATIGCQNGCTWGQPKTIKLGDVEEMQEWGAVDIPALLERAQEGDAQSQYDLGYNYIRGGHVRQDMVEATKWFLLAAEQGHMEGQFRAGMAYAEGYGVDVDQAMAVRWFRAAAEQGMSAAQFNLALAYAEGRSGEPNPAEAVQWYRKAGEQDIPQAWLNLGALYEAGQGVEQDVDEALELYLRAANSGIPQGALNVGRLFGEADDCETAYMWLQVAANRGQASAAQPGLEFCAGKLTPDQIASATEQAEQWQPDVLRDALKKVQAETEAAAE